MGKQDRGLDTSTTKNKYPQVSVEMKAMPQYNAQANDTLLAIIQYEYAPKATIGRFTAVTIGQLASMIGGFATLVIGVMNAFVGTYGTYAMSASLLKGAYSEEDGQRARGQGGK